MHAHPATFKGLHGWTKRSFQKLGWMILAIKYGDTVKVNAYLESLDNLKASLEDKITKVTEKDRILDLNILLEQVNYLIDFAKTNIKSLPAPMQAAFGSRRR